MTSSELSVVLCSGGMDSCVTAALAAQQGPIALLHASYGQRTERRERQAFEAIGDALDVDAARRRVLNLDFLAALGGSALTDERIDVPTQATDGVPTTYVPFRNAQLLSAAVAWAEVLPANSVWIGAVEEDSSGYPDCRESFLQAFEHAVRLGSKAGPKLSIRAPLVHLSKEEIVREGLRLRAPLELTWSCYQASDLACGACDSCRLRLSAFERAGFHDPIRYAL